MLRENYIGITILNKFPKTIVFLAGSLLKFCFCKGTTFPILLVPVFAILLYAVYLVPKKSAFKLGYVFGLGYFASTLYWVANSFECVGLGKYGYLAVGLLVMYLSLYPAIATFLSKLCSSSKTSLILVFPFFWVMTEYLRGIVFTGFPWNFIGQVSYDIPYFAQSADIFGIYGVSFLTVLVLCLLIIRKTFLCGIALFALTLSYGYYKVNIYDGYETLEPSPSITLIQPSITQEEKMDPSKVFDNIIKQIELSSVGMMDNTIVIWPEAALGVNTSRETLEGISTKVFEHAQNSGYLVVGCDTFRNGKLYNSVLVIDGKTGEIVQTYDKRHLLPFGEFIPEFLLDLGIRKVTSGIINFTKGNTKRTIKAARITTPFDIVVCYEAVFSGEITDDQNDGGKWILNLTNDAWFKNSDGPTQHLKIVAFRAIEEGKPLIRCANNGISAIIDCNGRILKTLGTNEIGKIETLVPGRTQKTIFSKIFCSKSVTR